MSPQVSRTLNILADLNNCIVWIVWVRLFTKPLEIVSRIPFYNWYHRYFHFSLLFRFSVKVQVLVPLSVFFDFPSVVWQDRKVLFFLVNHHLIWSSGQCLKIPENFACHILQERFYFVYIRAIMPPFY